MTNSYAATLTTDVTETAEGAAFIPDSLSPEKGNRIAPTLAALTTASALSACGGGGNEPLQAAQASGPDAMPKPAFEGFSNGKFRKDLGVDIIAYNDRLLEANGRKEHPTPVIEITRRRIWHEQCIDAGNGLLPLCSDQPLMQEFDIVI